MKYGRQQFLPQLPSPIPSLSPPSRDPPLPLVWCAPLNFMWMCIYLNNDTEHIILQFFLSLNLLFEINPYPYSYMCEYIYIYT